MRSSNHFQPIQRHDQDAQRVADSSYRLRMQGAADLAKVERAELRRLVGRRSQVHPFHLNPKPQTLNPKTPNPKPRLLAIDSVNHLEAGEWLHEVGTDIGHVGIASGFGGLGSMVSGLGELNDAPKRIKVAYSTTLSCRGRGWLVS